jgi:stage V sporulation protein AB
MKNYLLSTLAMLWGLASGLVIATAFTSFITILGVIPRIATKLNIKEYYFALGNSVTAGVLVGSILYLFEPFIKMPTILTIVVSLCFGIFIGCLALAIAEVLDVMPILNRRVHFKRAISFFIIAFSFGKMLGAFCYWIFPGFINFTT